MPLVAAASAEPADTTPAEQQFALVPIAEDDAAVHDADSQLMAVEEPVVSLATLRQQKLELLAMVHAVAALKTVTAAACRRVIAYRRAERKRHMDQVRRAQLSVRAHRGLASTKRGGAAAAEAVVSRSSLSTSASSNDILAASDASGSALVSTTVINSSALKLEADAAAEAVPAAATRLAVTLAHLKSSSPWTLPSTSSSSSSSSVTGATVQLQQPRALLRSIELTGDSIGDAGAVQLSSALKGGSGASLTYLSLAGNGITPKGAAALAGVLKSLRALRELHLGSNAITDTAVRGLTSALTCHPSLTTLNLCHNPIARQTTCRRAACEIVASRLTDWHALCAAGAKLIAVLLSQRECRLQTLSLGGTLGSQQQRQQHTQWPSTAATAAATVRDASTVIGDEGTIALAAALLSPHACPLRRLRLINAGLGRVGVRAIAAVLHCKTNLIELDLSGNQLQGDAADVLIRAIRVATTSATAGATAAGSTTTKQHTLAPASITAQQQQERQQPLREVTLRSCGLTRQQLLQVRALLDNTIAVPEALATAAAAGATEAPTAAAAAAAAVAVVHRPALTWLEEKTLGGEG
eukprot:19490-Heterococcus_DN1.PRE.1